MFGIGDPCGGYLCLPEAVEARARQGKGAEHPGGKLDQCSIFLPGLYSLGIVVSRVYRDEENTDSSCAT